MTDSFRRRPYASYVGGSQKRDKRICNRIMRRTNRVLARLRGEDALYLRHDEALNKWSMAQDGTRHYRPYNPRGWRTYREWYRWALSK